MRLKGVFLLTTGCTILGPWVSSYMSGRARKWRASSFVSGSTPRRRVAVNGGSGSRQHHKTWQASECGRGRQILGFEQRVRCPFCFVNFRYSAFLLDYSARRSATSASWSWPGWTCCNPTAPRPPAPGAGETYRLRHRHKTWRAAAGASLRRRISAPCLAARALYLLSCQFSIWYISIKLLTWRGALGPLALV